MRFYCIVGDKNTIFNKEAFDLLENSVKRRNIDWILIEAEKTDISVLLDMKIKPGDMVYRLGLGDDSKFSEALLIRDGISSFYRCERDVFSRSFSWGGAIKMMHSNVAIIPTRFIPQKCNKSILKENTDLMGGFPVVVKSSGGSHGSGVRLANSLDELNFYINELKSNGRRIVLRKFITNARHIRCVVIGDKVVDAIEYLPVEGDFRTNATETPKVKPFLPDDAIFKLAETAVKAGVTEFGGVDILIGSDGTAYVAEVNFPCNFARNQLCTGVDISGMMVDYLTEKANLSPRIHNC